MTINRKYDTGKLHTAANSFRPKSKPVYEAEPVNLPPPRTEDFSMHHFRGPRDVVGDYKKLNAIQWNRANEKRYRRSKHR